MVGSQSKPRQRFTQCIIGDSAVGISKRCCPVCEYSLCDALPITGVPPFVIKGSHTSATPCPLPDCLSRKKTWSHSLGLSREGDLATVNAAARGRSLSPGKYVFSLIPSGTLEWKHSFRDNGEWQQRQQAINHLQSIIDDSCLGV